MAETKVTYNELVNPYKFMAIKTSPQNISDAAWTDVTWSEQYDTNSNFDGTSYTAPVDGYYHFNASVITKCDSNTMVYGAIKLIRNDGKVIGYNNHYSPSYVHQEVSIPAVADVYLTAGQSVKIMAYIDVTSGTPVVWGEAVWTNHFSGHLFSL